MQELWGSRAWLRLSKLGREGTWERYTTNFRNGATARLLASPIPLLVPW